MLYLFILPLVVDNTDTLVLYVQMKNMQKSRTPKPTTVQNPGDLIVTEGATQYQIAQQKAEHEEATRLFREVLGVERALIQQINGAIEAKYLRALRNPVTQKINKTIPQIFAYLFEAYGDVSPEELADLKDKVQKLTYPITEPVDTVFAEIDDLANLSRLAKSPLTEQQKIDFGYLILQRLRPYGSTLTKWNEKDPAFLFF